LLTTKYPVQPAKPQKTKNINNEVSFNCLFFLVHPKVNVATKSKKASHDIIAIMIISFILSIRDLLGNNFLTDC